jgi:hypothetical protein
MRFGVSMFVTDRTVAPDIGAGWNRPEVEHHGTPWASGFAVMRERVAELRARADADAALAGRFA